MVRRHLLPPGKFETFQPINTTVITNNNQQQNNINYQQKQSDMARIIPKSLTINQSHQNGSTTESSLATIHLGKNLKCPVKTVLLHGDLNEALASEMMPPPPPPAPLPPPLYRYPSPLPQIPPSALPNLPTLPSFKTIMTNAANNILMPHHDTGSGEVEFYKTETEMDNLNKKRHGSGSVSSGGSANQDDFDDEEGPINRIIGRTTSFYKFFRLHQPCLGIL